MRLSRYRCTSGQVAKFALLLYLFIPRLSSVWPVWPVWMLVAHGRSSHSLSPACVPRHGCDRLELKRGWSLSWSRASGRTRTQQCGRLGSGCCRRALPWTGQGEVSPTSATLPLAAPQGSLREEELHAVSPSVRQSPSSPPFQRTASPAPKLRCLRRCPDSRSPTLKHILESHGDVTTKSTPPYTRRAQIVRRVLLITRTTSVDLDTFRKCRAAWRIPIVHLWWPPAVRREHSMVQLHHNFLILSMDLDQCLRPHRTSLHDTTTTSHRYPQPCLLQAPAMMPEPRKLLRID